MTNPHRTSSPANRPVRLELDQRRAQAVHAALSEALNADLLAGDPGQAAREVLEQLDRRVPGWLETGVPAGQAGYLVAAEAVLRALVCAEEDRYARSSLSEPELLRALGDAKPLGATASDVLERMRRERLITRHHASRGDERCWAAAPAGRQFLHRDSALRDDAWAVRDPLALLDLIYADGRGGNDAFLPWVQAIGRLDSDDLAPLLDALHREGLIEAADDPTRRRQWLTLSSAGLELARTRWREAAPGRSSFERPARPPLPYRRGLPLRGLTPENRSHPSDGYPCAPASWLQRSSPTRLWSTLKRDGVVEWHCRHCNHLWLVYLQATTRDDRPAYSDPASASYNRPAWRPEGYRWR